MATNTDNGTTLERNESSSWKIFVRREDYVQIKEEVTVPPDCSIPELLESVRKVFKLRAQDFTLDSPSGSTLHTDRPNILNERLSFFDITDGSDLLLMIKRLPLKPLPGLVTITTNPDELDLITYEDSPDKLRAKMHCGHVIGPDSMALYCFASLKSRMVKFICPAEDCGVEWPFKLVCHVACFIPSELEEMESKLALLQVERASGIQQCPGCKNWCCRDDITNNRIICSVCSKKSSNGKTFQFCWQCLGVWKGTWDCGNKNCRKDEDPRIKFLATCPEKQIENIMAPSFRGCPKCGVYVAHKINCKHVVCERCNWPFCFFCLRSTKNGTWQCEAYSGDCAVAERQKWLPNSKNDKFEGLQSPCSQDN